MRRGEAAWAMAAIGWLAVQASTREAAVDSVPRAAAPRAIDLARSPPRELRALPGIGEVKALAIARERWRLRPRPATELDLEALPGIGPKTAAAVREALAAAEDRE